MKKQEYMEKKVFSYIEKHDMIQPNDKIVVGVSGGADSVCLLFLLLEYSKKIPVTLNVIHVNHGIRKDAQADASYVQTLCEQHHISCRVVNADVPERARLEKCSEEDAGRRVRYEAFEDFAKENGASKIAVAHHGDDNAETILHHLFRGSGLSGLCGIAPVRSLDKNGCMQIIRPLLCLERREIEEYLQEKEILWCTDYTNETDDYTRNKIRHHILPYAEQNIGQGVTARMCKTAELLQETESFMEQQTKEALQKCQKPADNRERFVLERECFLGIHPALQSRILMGLAKELSPTGKDISLVHVEDMRKVIAQEGNHSVDLPFGIVVRRQYDEVILERNTLTKEWSCPNVQFLVFPMEKSMELPTNQYTKWFDYDKINRYPEIRTRRTGDYLTIRDNAGNSRHKMLKDYMITEKIPKNIRDLIPVLAVGSHVLWLIGYRISEDFKVGENTKQILQAEIILDKQAEQKTEEKNG